MRLLNIVLHIIKMILRVSTYAMGIVILLGYFGDYLNFMPANLSELFACYADVPFSRIWGMYWSGLFHFFALPIEALLFCGFTMIPLILRICFTGMYNAFSHEFETGDYTLVHVKTGNVVGGGFDGSGMVIVVIVRLLLCMLLLSLSVVLVPILFVFDIIKAVKFFFD